MDKTRFVLVVNHNPPKDRFKLGEKLGWGLVILAVVVVGLLSLAVFL